MHTTLIIMAAGIGSRFGGGIKQLARMSDNGEIIMDYSIYDAKEAGFDKVVFIIRKKIETEFQEAIGNRIAQQIPVEYVFQELDDLPKGYTVPEGREKPWGTGQAVLCCKDIVKEPFAIINADDYYGKEAFRKLHDFLVSEQPLQDRHKLAMAGFILKNTLSENGTVTRGVCNMDRQHLLTEICETKGIRMENQRIICDNEAVQAWIQPDTLVSMNMWAGYPDFLDSLADGFKNFLSNPTDIQKKEYLIPIIIGEMIENDQATVKVLETNDRWIGITYKEDLEKARAGFQKMIASGKYPKKLWES